MVVEARCDRCAAVVPVGADACRVCGVVFAPRPTDRPPVPDGYPTDFGPPPGWSARGANHPLAHDRPTGSWLPPTPPHATPPPPANRALLAIIGTVVVLLLLVLAVTALRSTDAPDDGAAPATTMTTAPAAVSTTGRGTSPSAPRTPGPVRRSGDRSATRSAPPDPAWRTALPARAPEPTWSGPLVVDDTLVVISDTDAVGLAAGDGRVTWEVPVVGPVHGDGLATTNGLVIAHLAETVTALDPRDGHGVWSRPLPDRGTMAALDGTVVVDDGTSIVAMDATTGQQLWAQPSGADRIPRPLTIGPHVLAPGGTVPLFAYTAGDITTRAFDLRGGDERWRVDAARRGGVAAIVHTGSTVCVLRGTSIETFDATDGSRIWSGDVPGLESSEMGDVAWSNGDEVVAFRADTLSAVNVRSGEVRWTVTTPDVGTDTGTLRLTNSWIGRFTSRAGGGVPVRGLDFTDVYSGRTMISYDLSAYEPVHGAPARYQNLIVVLVEADGGINVVAFRLP